MKVLLVSACLALSVVSCASIVAPGQTREAMEESGATRWALYEYDFDGSHYVWIPHWNEGLLHLSSPTASNAKSMDVLQFKDNVLLGVAELGKDRAAWAEMLKAHGKISPAGEIGLASPLYMAVTEKLYHVGDPIECVLFSNGFPRYGATANPRCFRTPNEIRRDSDALYYVISRGGQAMEVCIKDGHVSEIRPADHISKDWSNFYHRPLP